MAMEKKQAGQRRRPLQARARVTYDSILEAALLVIARDGATALNTNAVAERAGVSIGTLYQYFPDKEAILLAAAQRELAKPAPPQRNLFEALVRALEQFLDARGAARSLRRSASAIENGARRVAGRVEDAFVSLLLVPVPRPVRVGRR